jgi:hypothetical protein
MDNLRNTKGDHGNTSNDDPSFYEKRSNRTSHDAHIRFGKRVEHLLKKSNCSLTRQMFKKNSRYSYEALNYEDVHSRQKCFPKWIGVLRELTKDETSLHVDLDKDILRYMAKRNAIYKNIRRGIQQKRRGDIQDVLKIVQLGTWRKKKEADEEVPLNDDMITTCAPSEENLSGRLILKIKMRSKFLLR